MFYVVYSAVASYLDKWSTKCSRFVGFVHLQWKMDVFQFAIQNPNVMFVCCMLLKHWEYLKYPSIVRFNKIAEDSNFVSLSVLYGGGIQVYLGGQLASFSVWTLSFGSPGL